MLMIDQVDVSLVGARNLSTVTTSTYLLDDMGVRNSSVQNFSDKQSGIGGDEDLRWP